MPDAFKITDAHLQAFSHQQNKRFEDEMIAYFRQHYPQESAELGEDGLRKLISEGVEKAKTYYIYREVDVARYLQFRVAIRQDFDDCRELPWVHEILTSERLLAPDKLEQIARRWTASAGEA
jgi:hypothetical protein